MTAGEQLCSVSYILDIKQHPRAIAPPGLAAARCHRSWLIVLLAARSFMAKADDAPGALGTSTTAPAQRAASAYVSDHKANWAREQPLPDKSGYTLFNPTPEQYMREFNADRPDRTDCPFTVDAGHFQLEMDYANYTSDSPSGLPAVKAQGYQIAPMNLKLGVLNNVDLQLALSPYQRVRIKDETSGAVRYQSGFGDLTPRVKVSLIGNDGGFFALALIPFVKLPTAQDSLGNGAYEGGLAIPYAFDVPNWDVGFQTSFNAIHDDAGKGYHAEFANSVTVGHALIGKLSYSVEFFSSVSTERGAGWVGTVDTWLTYQLNKNLRLDGGVYIGVTKAADDLHLWLGMTWRH